VVRCSKFVIGDPIRLYGVVLDVVPDEEPFMFWPSNPTIYVATDGRRREEDDWSDTWVIAE